MAEDVSDQVFAYGGPTGWKLDTPGGRDHVFAVGGLVAADEHRVKVARQYFTEASAEQYEQQGKEWVDRDTGERYRLVGFDPTLSENPTDTGVSRFWVTGDGYLVFLRLAGVTSRSRNVAQGAVGVVQAR